MNCPYCGHELREGDKYCSNCAAPVSSDLNAQSSLEPDSDLYKQGSLQNRGQASLENETGDSKHGQVRSSPSHQTARPSPSAFIIGAVISAAVLLFFVSAFVNWQRGRRLDEAQSQNTAAPSDTGDDAAEEEAAAAEEPAARDDSGNPDVTYIPAPEIPDSDYDYVMDKGYITIGVTDYPPFACLDQMDSAEPGFDIELIYAVLAHLGLELDYVQFVEINWDNKLNLLNNKEIDCIWNALPITEEYSAAMEISIPYMTYEADGERTQLGVGFRKGSDLCELINDGLEQCIEDGTVDALAEGYGIKLVR